MKRIFIVAAGLLVSAAAFAQNLNPTVEVTNAYIREASGIEKPSQLREIPDSVLRFNLDFDYAVNETPYRGAYEFKPYLVQLRPQVRPSSEGTLFLQGGAGYTLHPELLVVYTPVKTKHMRVNLTAEHQSYWGPYYGDWNGKDVRTNAGADMLLGWRSGLFRVSAGYRNIFAEDAHAGMNHHQVLASAQVKNIPGTTKVDYDVNTQVSYVTTPGGFNETFTNTDAQVGFRFLGRNLRLVAQAQTVSQPTGSAAVFQVAPRYIRGGKRLSFNAGVKFSFVVRSGNGFAPTSGWIVYPDVQLSWRAVPEYLTLFGMVTGGQELVSYSTLLDQNHFIDAFTWNTDVKSQKILAMLGVRGNVARRFSYEIKGGYSWLGNSWLWGKMAPTGAPAMCYGGPIHTATVIADAGWNNHFLDVKAQVKYMKTLNKPTVITAGVLPFLPGEWTASGHVFYNWGGRIRAGVTAEGRSEMVCPAGGGVAGYVDLGLQGSFQFSPSLGFWLKMGNLLNQEVQRVPFYAEKGLYCTVGATWNI